MSNSKSADNKINSTTIKRIIIISVIIMIILVASIISILYKNNQSSMPVTATIYQNGVVVKIIDLTTAEDGTIDITDKSGHINTISIQNHDICMLSAACPDKLCVKQGYASKTVVPIVCLPNKIVIKVNYTLDKEAYDAVTY